MPLAVIYVFLLLKVLFFVYVIFHVLRLQVIMLHANNSFCNIMFFKKNMPLLNGTCAFAYLYVIYYHTIFKFKSYIDLVMLFLFVPGVMLKT